MNLGNFVNTHETEKSYFLPKMFLDHRENYWSFFFLNIGIWNESP